MSLHRISSLVFVFMLTLCPHTLLYAQSPETTMVIIVRHAEKLSGAEVDPDLSAIGLQRAQKLSDMLKDVKVDKLYATPYKRTQQTLESVSKSGSLKIDTYDPGKMAALAQDILNMEGKTVLIAGHANTAPELANMLLKDNRYSQLAEGDYGKVWMITLSEGKPISCVVLNY